MFILKNYFFSLLITITSIIILLFGITILYYNNLLDLKVYNFLKIFITIIGILLGSFILGRSSNSKGYLHGLRFGLLLVFIILIPTIIWKELELKLLIYYGIIISTSTIGGILGIEKKED